jgi:hypothetical protein
VAKVDDGGRGAAGKEVEAGAEEATKEEGARCSGDGRRGGGARRGGVGGRGRALRGGAMAAVEVAVDLGFRRRWPWEVWGEEEETWPNFDPENDFFFMTGRTKLTTVSIGQLLCF